MKRKRVIKRTISMFLSLMLILTLFPSSVFAEELASPTDPDGNTSVTTEETTEEVTTEETTEETTSEDVSVDILPTFDKLYDGVSVDGKDFSSCELLIATSDAGIFTADTEVVSEYNGIYLTRYADSEQTKSAYTYYYTKASLVEPNTSFKGADGEEGSEEEISEDDGDVPQQEVTETEEIANDGHGESDLTDINTGDDAFSNVNDIEVKEYKKTIALIDSGIDESIPAENIVDKISVIGDDSKDDNGHGTKMAKVITNINPDVQILSIKALDENCEGSVADIYAAIQYAIDAKVTVINLSLSSIATADSELVAEAIKEADKNGIAVVVAAGNNNKDAKYFSPANVKEAITVGAVDSNGQKLNLSNYGECVDYYMASGSTSEAAAMVSAYYCTVFTNSGEYNELEAAPGIFLPEFVDKTYPKAIDGWTVSEDTTENAEYKGSVPNEVEWQVVITGTGAGPHKHYEGTVTIPNKATLEARIGATITGERTWCQSSVEGANLPAPLYGGMTAGPTVTLTYNSATGEYICTRAYGDGSSVQYLGVAFRIESPPVQPKHYYIGIHKSGLDDYDQAVDKSLDGIKYGLYRMRNGSEETVAIFTLGADGWPRTGNNGADGIQVLASTAGPDDKATLRNGHYYLHWETTTYPQSWYFREISTNNNYAIDINDYNVTLDSTTDILKEAKDYEATGMIQVIKRDASNKSKLLKGAQYTVYSDSACTQVVGKMGYKVAKAGGGYTDVYETSSYGIATLTGLDAGTYYVKETKAPDGYEKNNKVYTVKVKTDKDKIFSYGNRYMGYTFDPDYYYQKYKSDFDAHGITEGKDLFMHFMNYGLKEGRVANNTFSVNEYLADNPDLTTAWNKYSDVQKSWYGNDIKIFAGMHYAFYGAREGRRGRAKSYYQNLADGVTDNNTVAVTIAASDDVPVYAYITKKSADTSCTKNNVNYDLKGARYKLYTKRSDAISDTNAIGTWNIDSDGKGVDSAGAEKIIEVSNHMLHDDATGTFAETTFYVKEVLSGKNYQLDPDVHTLKVTAANIESNPATADVSDVPVDDPFKLMVVKTIQGSTGGEALEGAEFTLKFYPEDITKHYTFAQLKSKTAKETIKITTQKHTNPATGETKIYAELPEGKMFPIGYLTVEETKAPEGYKIDGSKATVNGDTISVKMAFELRAEGDSTTGYQGGDPYIVNDDGTTTKVKNITVQNPTIGINVEEQQVRADIEVIKYDERKEGIEGAEFEVLNLDTNESHTFKVDKDGYYCSDAEYVSHSAENGLWFAEGPQGTADTPDDEQRALPIGKYRLTEKDAKGHQKEESIDFEVVDDNDGKPIKIYDKGRGDGLELISDMDMPTLGTKAFAETIDGNIKTVPADKGQTVHDICTYKNLKCGTTFTLIGKLMKKNADGTAEPFISNGEEVVGRTTFTTKDTYEQSQYEASGEATVEFSDLDFTDLEDTEFVVYERLYLGDVSIEDAEAGNYEKKYIDSNNDVVTFPIKHEKADDKDQTITTAGGITTAMGGDGTKNISTVETETVTIVDTVEYFNLNPGTEYEAVGKLYLVTDKDDGKKYSDYSEDELKKMAVKDDDGNVITASTKFTATKSNGKVDVTFTFPAAKLSKTEGESVVVFEDCYDNNKVKYFSHAVVTDTQIVNPPSISTTAKGTEGRSELAYNQGKFVDTIHYSNLQANSTFLVKGIAMDKDTKQPLKLNGKEVVAEAEFTTGDANMPFNAVKGDFDLEFKITEDQYADLKDKDIVIFETLYNAKGTLIAVHRDLDDKGQELTISKVQTTLTDKKTGTHVAYPDQETTLLDSVSYKRLIAGKQYVLSGILMNRSTNKPLLDENGKEITGSTTFTASESGSGTVDVVFKFNAKILKIQGTSIVAFEKVTPSDGTIPVCVHMDINDKEQTVDIPKVGTKVSKSSFGSKDTIKFSDVISYTNLTVGYTYVAKGWLVDSKGNKLTVDGKEISVEKEFKPESPNGTVEVPFPEFNGKGLNGKYVVFEEVYVKVEDAEKKTTSTHLVGEHKDLTDNNQTISVTPGIKTGDSSKLILMILLLASALMGIGTVIVIKRKRR